jgi:transketolase
MEAFEVSALKDKCRAVRRRVMEILFEAGGGHYGGSLSCVEILVALYFHTLRIDPKNPNWAERDRFVLSKGHACASFVSVLGERGFFPTDLLHTFNKLDSPFGMHPDMQKIIGCDMSTGSLGHGLPIAIGMALAGKLDQRDYRVFVLVGDGECQEGSIWEGAAAATHFGLDNLILIVDRNRLSMDGPTEEIMALGDLKGKFEAFGWVADEIDGNDIEKVIGSLDRVPFGKEAPSVIVANTTKGKGVSCMENVCEWHYKQASEEITRDAIRELELAGGLKNLC